METNKFSTQKGKAYYYDSISDFITREPSSIIGKLVENSFEIGKEQIDAWKNQVEGLQTKLKAHGVYGDIIFEYDIIRLGKRIDVVLLIKHMVFSLEFKNGKESFVAKDEQQAEDYAIDIKNFHKESENLYVCPILIATKAKTIQPNQSIESYPDKQIKLQKENIETVVPKVKQIAEKYGNDQQINFEKWFNSPYHPTPTIIAAAIEAYRTHSLSEIANSEAGQENIEICEKEIQSIIEWAQANKKKVCCFVTGVPGAGKTLVGLDIVAKGLEKKERPSIYLSGNGPLTEVLSAAIKKQAKSKNKNARKNAIESSSINVLIQSSFAFKRETSKSESPTPEKVVVFDEAQRCWSKEKMSSKHKGNKEMQFSEPHYFYKVMNRQKIGQSLFAWSD